MPGFQEEGSQMTKKKKADIGKLIDAQAKGKKVKRADTSKGEAGEVDRRITKESISINFGR
ncbi:MAG: hypothetical protein NVS9B1_11560 [Candidatus Dormibacteraceae bacterium]